MPALGKKAIWRVGLDSDTSSPRWGEADARVVRPCCLTCDNHGTKPPHLDSLRRHDLATVARGTKGSARVKEEAEVDKATPYLDFH